MCGIAGIITKDSGLARGALNAMLCAQTHRGPDDSGEEILTVADPVGPIALGLGQRRLSIIDLSPAGHQPMVNTDTGDVIIFNGELYNFRTLREPLEKGGVRFRGYSDTEVLLHALSREGARVLERCEGMYALAFYNARKGTLLLARDHVGIKPLYIARGKAPAGSASPGAPCIAFASEVRAVLQSGIVSRRIEPRAVAGMLAYGAVQEPHTIFAEVSSFPAGSYQEIDLHRALNEPLATPRRFWNFPQPDGAITEAAAVDDARTLLDLAVRDHLVSDVPVGIFLSSGTDSTIMAGLAARHAPNIRTFTVGFDDNPDMSEAQMARRTAQAFGLPHQDIQVTSKDAEAAATAWLIAQDQPSMDGLNVFVVSGAVKRAGITVAISGQGGDEVFGGYPSFADVPRLQRLHRACAWLPAPGRRLAALALSARKPASYREKMTDVLLSGGSVTDLYFHRRRLMSDAQLHGLGLRAQELGLSEHFVPREALAACPVREDDPVWSVSRLESTFYMGNMLLHDGDANGMAHSLEIRVPFLDRRVLDRFLAVPGTVRLPTGVNNKHLLRLAFKDLLRDEIVSQKKRPFTLPIKRWMAGPMRPMCEEAVARARGLGMLRPEGVDAVWRAFIAEPESSIWSRALALVALGCYVKQNGVVSG